MPHYTCTVIKDDGSSKTCTITGKDAPSAKRQAELHHPKCRIENVKLRPAQKKPAAVALAPSAAPLSLTTEPKAPSPQPKTPPTDETTTKPKPSGRVAGAALDRLYYLQHGKCFYCGSALDRADASVDHIHPKSKGGTNVDDNLVVCCKRLNIFFGDRGVKEKMSFLVNASGNVMCPTKVKTDTSGTGTEPKGDNSNGVGVLLAVKSEQLPPPIPSFPSVRRTAISKVRIPAKLVQAHPVSLTDCSGILQYLKQHPDRWPINEQALIDTIKTVNDLSATSNISKKIVNLLIANKYISLNANSVITYSKRNIAYGLRSESDKLGQASGQAKAGKP